VVRRTYGIGPNFKQAPYCHSHQQWYYNCVTELRKRINYLEKYPSEKNKEALNVALSEMEKIKSDIKGCVECQSMIS
jgi:hypothetical protein